MLSQPPSLSFPKASQQLRFIRQWSTFGKALQKSARELLGIGLAFVILTLAYTQLGYLVREGWAKGALSHQSIRCLCSAPRGRGELGPFP